MKSDLRSKTCVFVDLCGYCIIIMKAMKTMTANKAMVAMKPMKAMKPLVAMKTRGRPIKPGACVRGYVVNALPPCLLGCAPRKAISIPNWWHFDQMHRSR